MQFRLGLLASSVFATAAWAIAAQDVNAQQAQPASPEAAEAAGDRPVADDEVMVTAQRRSQRLQDVPIAVTAVSADQLEALQITNSLNLSQVTPGLLMSESSSFVQPFIRGVGSTTTNLGEQTSVATYIDGVYMPLIQSANYELANISGIEVLKGPQGTLFGRNTSGGAILISTLAPSQEFGGRAEVTYGNYNTRGARGFVTGGITDTVAASLAASYSAHDGWLDDKFRGGSIGDAYRYAVRGSVLWEPTSKLTIDAHYDYSFADDVNGILAHPVSGFQGSTPALPQSPGFYDYSGDVDAWARTYQSGASVRVRYAFDHFDVMSLTSNRTFKTANDYDSDSTPIGFSNIEDTEKGSVFSQELQIQSNGDGAFSWMVGGFYYDQDTSYAPLRVRPLTGLTTILATHGNEAYALFADGTYDFGVIEVTAGVRYNREEKNYTGFLNGNRLVNNANKSWESTTPRLVVSYKPSRDFLVYGSYSQGFKSGAFNASSFNPVPVNPETIDAYELGLKISPSSRATINASVFLYETEDLQVQSLNTANNLVTIANAAASETVGADAEFILRPVDALSLRFGISYLDAEYTDFRNAQIFIPATPPALGNVSVIRNVSGNAVVRSPDWTLNFGAEYTVDLAGGGSVVPSLNLFASDSFFWDAGNRLEQDAYTLVNGQLTWNLPGDRASISVFGKNLTDEEVWRSLTPSAQADRGVPGEPRLYGVRLGYEF